MALLVCGKIRGRSDRKTSAWESLSSVEPQQYKCATNKGTGRYQDHFKLNYCHHLFQVDNKISAGRC